MTTSHSGVSVWTFTTSEQVLMLCEGTALGVTEGRAKVLQTLNHFPTSFARLPDCLILDFSPYVDKTVLSWVFEHSQLLNDHGTQVLFMTDVRNFKRQADLAGLERFDVARPNNFLSKLETTIRRALH